MWWLMWWKIMVANGYGKPFAWKLKHITKTYATWDVANISTHFGKKHVLVSNDTQLSLDVLSNIMKPLLLWCSEYSY